MLSVEIIGSIDGQEHYQKDYILQLLSGDAETLLLGSDFVGRPDTQIYADNASIIKIRAEFNFAIKQARRWALQSLYKEQKLAAHHPHKTWLLISKVANEAQSEQSVLIASICPRLKPLHMELKTAPLSADSIESYLNLFKSVFSLYLSVAKKTDNKLDEGLSNFGVDFGGKVYYLDDEYYAWDKFVSFSVMLGVYIRSFDWLDAAFIERLADILIAQLDISFQSNHCRLVIARQLHALFMPQGQKEALLHHLIDALLKIPKATIISTTDTIIVMPQPNRIKNNKPRYLALLADIHANYAALSCVLDYLAAHNIDEGIVLGDIVGYGPQPKECIERLQATNFQIIKGNHDHAVAIANIDTLFSAYARLTLQWTIDNLSIEHKQWLNDLPVFIETDNWFAVHGSPMDPEFFYGYVYMMTYEDNLQYMADKAMRLCFHGHSHITGVFARDKNNRDISLGNKKISLAAYNQVLVCPGSIGQPRNGCADAQFAIYDTELGEINFLSLPYAVQTVIDKMREVGLPEELGHRLLVGK